MNDEVEDALATRRENPLTGQQDLAALTRRESPSARPSGAEQVAPATRRETLGGQACSGRLGEGGGSGAESTVNLPAALRDRYTVLEELPNPGAEADVVLVREAAGTRMLIKLYRRGIQADRAVGEHVQHLSSPHVVRLIETGESSGRDHECREYLPGGNLLGLLPGPGSGLPDDILRLVTDQVDRGREALHGLGIVPCDLKPENILVRAHQPLQVVREWPRSPIRAPGCGGSVAVEASAQAASCCSSASRW